MKYLLATILLLSSTVSFGQSSIPDTAWVVRMDTVEVLGERHWANDTVRYRYNQMKYYVKTILPYLNEATRVFKELDALDPNIDNRERKAFVKEKEDQVRQKFEAEIKELNETQGVYLVKLIGRQTGVNIYEILKENKGGLAAMKWQAWAKVHGFNLNRHYDPNDEPWLESIMNSFGYPLPNYNYAASN